MLVPSAIVAGEYFAAASSRSSRRGDVLLGEQLALEVEPGREAHIGVGRTGEAVEAAVLAAAIGIDRPVERNVGRLVAGDDALRLLPRHLGRERLGRLLARPAVVEILAGEDLVAAGGVGRGAPPAPALVRSEAVGDRRGLWRGSSAVEALVTFMASFRGERNET